MPTPRSLSVLPSWITVIAAATMPNSVRDKIRPSAAYGVTGVMRARHPGPHKRFGVHLDVGVAAGGEQAFNAGAHVGDVQRPIFLKRQNIM